MCAEFSELGGVGKAVTVDDVFQHISDRIVLYSYLLRARFILVYQVPTGISTVDEFLVVRPNVEAFGLMCYDVIGTLNVYAIIVMHTVTL